MEIRTTSKGKPFLCLHGYEYVRDKVEKTKVYWKCVKFPKCKGRASCLKREDGTFTTAKVTNGHSHRPGSKRRAPAKIRKTKEGTFLLYDGFHYVKVNTGKDDKNWKCVEKHCTGRVITIIRYDGRPDAILVSDHNHRTSNPECSKCKDAGKPKQAMNVAGATYKCGVEDCEKFIHLNCGKTAQNRLFCCKEHRREYLKRKRGNSEASCDETDDEDIQTTGQNKPVEIREEGCAAEEGVRNQRNADEDQAFTDFDVGMSEDSDDVNDDGRNENFEADQDSDLSDVIILYEAKSPPPRKDNDDEDEGSLPDPALPEEKLTAHPEAEAVSSPGQTGPRKRKPAPNRKDKEGPPSHLNSKMMKTSASNSKAVGKSTQDSHKNPVGKSSETNHSHVKTHQNSAPFPSTERSLTDPSASDREEPERPEANQSKSVRNPVESAQCSLQDSTGEPSTSSVSDRLQVQDLQCGSVSDPAATSSFEPRGRKADVRRSEDKQSKHGIGTSGKEEDMSESDLSREYMESKIRKNNITIDKMKKEMDFMEEQHNVIIGKMKREIALLEEKKKREEERKTREEEQHNLIINKLRREVALMKEKEKKEEEREKRMEENHRRQAEMYEREMEESKIRQAWYKTH